MPFKLLSTHKIFLREFNNPVWNQCSYCLFNDSFSLDAIEDALNETVRKNDSLRMKIIDKENAIFEDYQPRKYERMSFDDLDTFLKWGHKKANEPVTEYPGMWNAYLITVGNKNGIFNVGQHIMCDAMNVTVLYQKMLNELKNVPNIDVSYSDYLESHEKYKNSKMFQNDEKFWNSVLSNDTPLAFGGSPVSECENISIPLPNLDTFCKSNNITTAAFWYAVTGLLILRLQDKESLSFGIPVIGRTTMKEMHSLGLYMRDMPMVMNGEEISFTEFAQNIANNLFDLFRHQNYDLPEKQFFDISIDFSQYIPTSDYELGVIYNDYLSTAMEFHYLKSDALNLTIRAQKNLFNDINIVTKALNKLVNSIIANPNQNIWNIPIGDAVAEGKNVAIPNKSLYTIIEKKKQGTIIDGNRRYSVNQLLDDAEKIDTYISGKKRVIGVICDNSYLQLAAIYGIIRGGNAYLPISPEFPKKRIATMIKQASCDTVLVQHKYKDIVSNPVVLEDILAKDKPINIPPIKALADDPLYLIFTSGSTGIPKGVLISNKSVVNRINWMCDKYFNNDSIIMRKTPYTFDVSVWEIFGFAFCGCSLDVLPSEDRYQMNSIIKHIKDNGVTDLHFVPTVYNMFLDVLEKGEDKLPSIKNVFVSGEALNASLANRSPFKLHNLYGPTECAVDVTSYECTKRENNPVPIGEPIDNCRIYILDKHLHSVPRGIIGEICVGGIPVGIGYLNNEKETNKSFVHIKNELIYLTGDYGYLREDNKVIFIGRNDKQIKINGQRIEIGDIESAIMTIVPFAVVVEKNNRLIAFYTGDEKDELSKQLSRMLPHYMIPYKFINVKEVPLLSNGKIDFESLLANDKSSQTSYSKPTNEEEKAICDLFSKVLNVYPVGVDDNFYDLGGTSLSMMNILLEDMFASISPSDFMSNPTPKQLAIRLKNNNKKSAIASLYVPTNPRSSLVLFPFAGGDGAEFVALVDEFRNRNSDIAIYLVSWNSNIDEVIEFLNEIKTPINFYSHCAGVVIAMKLLEKFTNVNTFIVGGNIPPMEFDNIWNNVSDEELINILTYAGMPKHTNYETTIRLFRDNTSQYFNYFDNCKKPINKNISLILAKNDIFTDKLFNVATKSWKRFVTGVDDVFVIESSSHYFQTECAKMLVDIISNKIKDNKE